MEKTKRSKGFAQTSLIEVEHKGRKGNETLTSSVGRGLSYSDGPTGVKFQINVATVACSSPGERFDLHTSLR